MTKKEFQNLKEDRLVDEVLVPLFAKMGYKDVFKHHGHAGEKGKDIVFWEEDKSGSRVNHAVVVKAVKLNGKSKSVEGSANEVSTQIRQSLSSPYMAPMTGELVNAHRCFVVTNKDIPKEALDAIKSMLGDNPLMFNQVNFWNGNKVWEMASKYLFSIPDTLDTLSQQLNDLKQDVIPEITISERGKLIRLLPRDEFAAQSSLEVNVTFNFSETNPSLSVYKEFQEFIDHGGQIKISGEYIAEFATPQIIGQILGNSNQKPTEMEFRTEKKDKIFPFKFELLKDDDTLYSVDYIAFKWLQGGMKSFTLSNEDQNGFFSIRMRMNNDGSCHLNLHLAVHSVSASTVRKSYDVSIALAKATIIRFTSLENEKVIFEAKNTVTLELPGEGYVKVIEILSKIEEKSGQEIIIPDRDLNEEEIYSIQFAEHILLYGQLKEKWVGPWELPISKLEPARVRDVLANLTDGQRCNLFFKGAGSYYKILDNKIDLGETELFFESVQLLNQNELEDWLVEQDYSKPISIIIEPGDSDQLIHCYPKFLPLK
jgi:hypothetical protein